MLEETVSDPPHDELFANSAFDIVAVVASAGGLRALTVLLSALPVEFPAAICIVQHLDPQHSSMMAEILQRRTSLAVKQAVDGDQLSAGAIFIAPPDRHLLVSAVGRLSLTQTALVHYSRPSADVLLDSIASSFCSRALAVVLTGAGSDGSAGVRAIKRGGGQVIAQDQASAEYFGMPGAAIQTGQVDYILPLSDIPAALIRLTRREGSPPEPDCA